MKELYLTSTPYHLMIAIAKASKSEKESELIILRCYEQADEYAEKLRSKDIFSSIRVVKGGYDAKSRNRPYRDLLEMKEGSKFAIDKEAIAELKNEDIFPRHIFVFNDNLPTNQYLLFRNQNAGGKNSYIEDGLGAYEQEYSHKLFLKKFLPRIYFGRWYQMVQKQGNTSYVDEMLVFNPEMIQDRNKPVKPLGELFQELDAQIIDNIFDVPDVNTKNLMIAPHSHYLETHSLKEKYLETIEPYLEDATVKYHPRERNYYLDKQAEQEIKNSTPSEALYLNFLDNPPKIVGDISTALYTAKAILPESEVISIAEKAGFNTSDDKDLLEKAGVKFL